MMRIIVLVISLVFVTFICDAKLTLPPLFGNNMVLQRNEEVNFWGKSDSMQKITITCSWDDKTYTTTVLNGSWKITVPTSEAGGPYIVNISDGIDNIRFDNVMLGEVWYCSGQSNMAMPLQGLKAGQPVDGYMEMVLGSKNNRNLRLFGIDRLAKEPFYEGKWQVASPESVSLFSAIGYWFGKRLNDFLDIPVGVICTARGGTRIELWSNPLTLKSYPQDEIKTKGGKNGILYYSLVKPMTDFVVKGFLWYQGESNTDKCTHYSSLMKDMVSQWRRDWNNEEAPFFYAQIAPCRHSTPQLREEQEKALALIPNSGMVATVDVGEPYCIHPAKKKEVAERFLLLALDKVYGIKGLHSESPRYKSMQILNNEIYVEFHHAPNGLCPRNDIVGFQIAGKDSVFVEAQAKYVYEKDKKNGIVVSSPEVKEPIAVRYCYDNMTVGNLYNTFGLPVFPFRTDNWHK